MLVYTNGKKFCLYLFLSILVSPLALRAQPEGQGNNPPPDEDADGEESDHPPDESQDTLVKRTKSGKLIHWGELSFVFSITPTDLIPMKFFSDAVKNSSVTWNDTGITPEILVDSLPGNLDVAEYDGVNSIFFVTDNWDFDPRFTILTFTHVDGNTGEILETDVAINGIHHVWDPQSTGEPVHDLQNVLTHEFGHAVGIPDFSFAEKATMYGYVIAGEVIKRDLADIDYRAGDAIYNSDELLVDDEGAGESNARGGCAQSQPTDLAVLFSILLLSFLIRRKSPSAAMVPMAAFLLVLPVPLFAQDNEEDERPDAEEGTTLYVAAVQGENTRLPSSDVVVETDDGAIVKVRVPGKINGNIHSLSFHSPLPAPGRTLVIDQFSKVERKAKTDGQKIKSFVSSSTTDGRSSRALHVENPKIEDQRLPGTDVIVKDQDGIVYRVRTPGRVQGDISSIAIHHALPDVGSTFALPPHAKPMHAIDGL